MLDWVLEVGLLILVMDLTYMVYTLRLQLNPLEWLQVFRNNWQPKISSAPLNTALLANIYWSNPKCSKRCFQLAHLDHVIEQRRLEICKIDRNAGKGDLL